MLKLFRRFDDRSMVVLLIVIAVVTHFAWLFNFSVFTSGDWWFISTERYHDFAHFSPIWITEGLGNTSAVPPFYFVRFLEGVLTLFGASFVVTEKLFFFIPIIFGSSLGAYLFLRQYFKPANSFIGAIIFSFNTTMLFNYAGALTIAAAYALTPVALYLFRQYLLKPKSKSLLVGIALVFAVMAAYEQRIVLLVIGMAVGMFLFYTAWRDRRWRYFRQRFWPLVKLLIIFGALHAFWLLPYAINARGGVTFSDLLSRELFESFSTVQNAVTLYHPFWTGARPATFVPQPIPLYAWIVPVVAFGGFLLPRVFRKTIRNYEEILFWALIALIGVFLVKQVNEPLVGAYPWLYGHLPGTAAFREASKFYLLNTLSYAVLIPFTLTITKAWLSARITRIVAGVSVARAAYVGLAGVVLVLFLGQAKPLVTGEFRTLYTARHMPADYKTLNDFISKQPEYFRVMWMPVNSRWGVQTDRHPSVAASQLNQGAWFKSLGADKKDSFPTMRDKAGGLVSATSSNDILDRASVKYVVVPLRDSANEDDFFRKYGDDRRYYTDRLDQASYLKKIDIGTKEVAVYENQQYQPHIQAFTALQTADAADADTLNRLYDFTAKQLKTAFNFVLPGRQGPSAHYPQTALTDMFQHVRPEDIVDGQLQKKLAIKNGTDLYFKDSRRLAYTIHGTTMTFSRQYENRLDVNGQKLKPDRPSEIVATATLRPDKPYFLLLNDKIADLAPGNGARDLGVVEGPLTLYEAAENTLPNGSFEQGLWQKKVGDCNRYDSQPDIRMYHDAHNASEGKLSLQFEVWKHTACTASPAVPLSSRDYMLSFDYQVIGGRSAGYEVSFNDPARTVIRKDFDTDHTYWQAYREHIQAPEGATTYTLRLLGLPDYLLRGPSLVNYDNVRMLRLQKRAGIEAEPPRFEKMPLAGGQQATFAVGVPGGRSGNLVKNNAFEQGLWQKKVGDCNRYDENAHIGMKLIKRTSKDQAIELSARRHAACTSQGGMPVQELHTYLLGFDYQSPNAKNAYYRVDFNDPAKTSIAAQAPVKGTDWQFFSTQIQAPAGATQAKILIFSYESSQKVQTMVNRYDNISLQEVPSTTGQYYLVSQPQIGLTAPRGVTFDARSPTAKTIRIQGATQPFYLGMSELYNPLWRLTFDGQKPLAARLPSLQTFAVSDTQHFKLNDFANGWYIDPAAVCSKPKAACTRHADGSYDIRLVAEYSAQRWFNVGAAISAITLASCLSYLIYERSRRKKAHQK